MLTCLSCLHMSCSNSSLSQLVFSLFSQSSFFPLLFFSLSSFFLLFFLSLSSFFLSFSSIACLTIKFLLDNNSLVSSACSPFSPSLCSSSPSSYSGSTSAYIIFLISPWMLIICFHVDILLSWICYFLQFLLQYLLFAQVFLLQWSLSLPNYFLLKICHLLLNFFYLLLATRPYWLDWLSTFPWTSWIMTPIFFS